MQFVDIEFPPRIAFGAQSNPSWETTLVTNAGGFDSAIENWEDARHIFEVAPAIRTAEDYGVVRSHFHQVRGRARSFPFKDFLDYLVSQTEGYLIAADGGGYQMHKAYGTGGDAYYRKITRPDSGTISVFRTRSSVTTNATGDATITYTTGHVAMANHIGGDTYKWSGTFKVPARYDADRLPSIVTNKSGSKLIVEGQKITIKEVRE